MCYCGNRTDQFVLFATPCASSGLLLLSMYFLCNLLAKTPFKKPTDFRTMEPEGLKCSLQGFAYKNTSSL